MLKTSFFQIKGPKPFLYNHDGQVKHILCLVTPIASEMFFFRMLQIMSNKQRNRLYDIDTHRNIIYLSILRNYI